MPDRSTGFFGVPTLTAAGVRLEDPAVLTTALDCASACGARSGASLMLLVTVANDGPENASGAVRVDVAGESYELPFEDVAPGSSVELRENATARDVALWWPRGLKESIAPGALEKATFSVGGGGAVDGGVAVGSVGSAAAVDGGVAVATVTVELRFGVRAFETFIDAQTKGRAFRVNGEQLFIRGGNWIGTDAAWRYSASRQRFDDEVRYHAEAGLNLIRVWGGGVAEADLFYEACDRAGVLSPRG